MKLLRVNLIVFLVILYSHEASALIRHTIVVNKWNNTLTYYETGQPTREFKVATGKYKCTPEGTFKVIQKSFISKNGNSPFGTRWLGLNTLGQRGWYHIGIHGTDQPKSIGKYASAACVRMYDHDVNWLYDHAPYGTTVRIVNVPIAQKSVVPLTKYSLIKFLRKLHTRSPISHWFELRYDTTNWANTAKRNVYGTNPNLKSFDVNQRIIFIQQARKRRVLLTKLESGYLSSVTKDPILQEYFYQSQMGIAS